jgi:hypothetical protein
MIKKIVLPGAIAGAVLLVLSFAMLFGAIKLFPALAEEYYNPVFRTDGGRNWMFYVHPFLLAMALSWFWERFKGQFTGSMIVRDLELGLVYTLIATLPAMWMTFSAFDISAGMLFTWLGYGFVQAVVAGVIFSRMNP